MVLAGSITKVFMISRLLPGWYWNTRLVSLMMLSPDPVSTNMDMDASDGR